jgi:hypothetical protein
MRVREQFPTKLRSEIALGHESRAPRSTSCCMAEPRRQAPGGWGSGPGSSWSADSGPVPLVPQRRAPDLSGMPPSRREPLQPPASAVQPARSPSPLGRRPGPPSRSFAPASPPPPLATAGPSHPVAGSSAALDAVLAVMGREQEIETNFLYAAQPRAAFPRAPSPLELDPGSPGAGASRTWNGGASAAGLEVLHQASSWSQQPPAAASRVAAPSYGNGKFHALCGHTSTVCCVI